MSKMSKHDASWNVRIPAAIANMAVEILEDKISKLDAQLLALKLENERLRKAGDAMASQITYESQMADDDWGVDTGTPKNVKAWLAAKEGGDAK